MTSNVFEIFESSERTVSRKRCTRSSCHLPLVAIAASASRRTDNRSKEDRLLYGLSHPGTAHPGTAGVLIGCGDSIVLDCAYAQVCSRGA